MCLPCAPSLLLSSDHHLLVVCLFASHLQLCKWAAEQTNGSSLELIGWHLWNEIEPPCPSNQCFGSITLRDGHNYSVKDCQLRKNNSITRNQDKEEPLWNRWHLCSARAFWVGWGFKQEVSKVCQFLRGLSKCVCERETFFFLVLHMSVCLCVKTLETVVFVFLTSMPFT